MMVAVRWAPVMSAVDHGDLLSKVSLSMLLAAVVLYGVAVLLLL
jgi:hypothetical protein